MSREYKAILQAAELPNVRFHDLRQTAATPLLAQPSESSAQRTRRAKIRSMRWIWIPPKPFVA